MKCIDFHDTFNPVLEIVKYLAFDAAVFKKEFLKIMGYNVLSLPALVVDEKVVAKGSQSYDKVKSILTGIK